MDNGNPPRATAHKREKRGDARSSLRRKLATVGASLGALVLVVALLVLVFGGTILNRYGKGRAEHAFAEAHPGSELRIGDLSFALGANRLVAQSVTLKAARTTVRVERLALTGVRWARLLRGKSGLADALTRAVLEAVNLDAEFPRSHYGLRCAQLRASAPNSELAAAGIELRTLVDDEAFFAAQAFRTTRLRVVVPELKALGLAYGDLLGGRSYRARSVHLSRPSLEALVNRDRPVEPFVRSPRMAHEALASIRKPLQVDSLSIAGGQVRYCERRLAGTDPGVLTFGAVSLAAAGISNLAAASAPIEIRAQGDLMNAGTLKVQMTIPVASPDFSLHYSGSLGAMDLIRLDAFLAVAEQTRIKSGTVQQVTFDIDVTAGRARGRVRAGYRNLKITVLGEQTSNKPGRASGFASFLANLIGVRNDNAPDGSGLMREGKVDYAREPGNEFLQFLWFALRSGVIDVISF